MSDVVAPTAVALSDYERKALEELYRWKNPPQNWRTRAADRVERAIEVAASRLPTKLVDDLFERALPLLNAAARQTTSEKLVLAAFQRRGHPGVRGLGDVASLTLEDVERVAGTKRWRELGKGVGEGGVTGFYGAPGAAADVPLVLGLALRHTNVCAYSYGFDPTTDDEQAYALSVVAASAAVGTQAKQLTRAALAFGEKMAGKEIAQKLLQRLPRELVMRIAAMNTSKAAPVAGAFTGAALNGWFLQNVAVQARFAYRQRFLERRHGPALLEAYGL